MNTTRNAYILVLCLALLLSGCAINLGPQTAELTGSSKPPVLRLDKITEKTSGEWPGGGIRPFLVNALGKPSVAGMFTKDDSGLATRIDLTSSHDDDNPRLIGLGLLSIFTVGIIPLHYRSVWPVTAEVTVRSDDGTVQGRYSVQSTGLYDIWAYPLTMFTLFGASMRSTADGQKVLQRTAGDLVSQVMREVDADYPRLAAVYRSQARAKAEPGAEAAARDEATVIRSDIDELPAAKARQNARSHAIVIGIEQYRQKLPRASFAARDAEAVATYLTRVLGYPEENVITLLNDRALKSDLEKYFEKWLQNNVEDGSTVFIYYSGHGAPNSRTGDAYIVPYDGDPAFIDETGFPLKRMYAALGKLPAKEVIVALDSCFSGAGGRSVIAQGSRPLVITLQNNTVLPKNLTVLSASAGDQTSSTYNEKGHGLFTYFMLKGIKNEDVTRPDGSLKIDDLYSYIKPQVERIARKQYNNEQTPQLMESKK